MTSFFARLRGTLTVLSLCVLSVSVWAQPAGYYSSAEGLTGTSLRNALHNIIDDHTVIPYSSSGYDVADALQWLDANPSNSSQVICIYKRTGMAISSWPNWNREHTWPQSYGVSSGPANSDLHHIFASDAVVNSTRGNKYFDNGGTTVSTAPLCKTTSTTWEPPAEMKGDIARAMLYMDVRYSGDKSNEKDLVVTDTVSLIQTNSRYMGRLSTLLAWHTQDPVSAAEITRNNNIYTKQFNRNPFVDRPEWVAAIFGGSSSPTPAPTATSIVPTPTPTTPPSSTLPLTNGVTVNYTVGTGAWVHYSIYVPIGSTQLVITSTGTGDADMYVRIDAQPTTSTWNFRPYLSGSNETVTINASSSPTLSTNRTYFISLYGYQAASGTLRATITSGTTSTPTPTPTTSAGGNATFTSVSTFDGNVLESGSNTNVGSSVNSTSTTIRIGDYYTKAQYRGFLHFDTSSIPDGAVITSAQLRIKTSSITGSTSTLGSLTVDIVNGSFSGSTTLQAGDWQAAATASGVATLSTPAAGVISSGNLTSTGLSAISKTGTTQFRVRFTTKTDNDGSSDYLNVHAAEATSSANRPVLVVTWQ